MILPPVRPSPCFDCPWVRTSAAGWLGPFNAEEWLQIAHSDIAIACHMTLGDGDEGDEPSGWDTPGVLQCAGAAIYRSNVHKDPRDPEVATLPADLDLVFGFGEFKEHHTR